MKKADHGQVKVALWTTSIAQKELKEAADGDAADMCQSCMRQRLDCQRIGPSSTEFKTCAAECSYCLKASGVPGGRCKPQRAPGGGRLEIFR